MKRTLLIGLLTLSLMGVGVAAEPQSKSGTGPHTRFGIKGGFMQPDGTNNDSAINFGVVVGQPIQRYFSWEGEVTLTASDGEVGANRNWDLTTIAGYGVFRSEGNIGFKGKAGLAYWDTDNEDDVSLSLGIGLGIHSGKNGMLDIEFTQIDDGVDFISVGYVFNFD